MPSLALDELCAMLWDMIRYENYDETSPYNREAAAWAKNQTTFACRSTAGRCATARPAMPTDCAEIVADMPKPQPRSNDSSAGRSTAGSLGRHAVAAAVAASAGSPPLPRRRRQPR